MTPLLLLQPGLPPATFERPAVDAHHAPDLSRRYSITARWGDEDAPILHWMMLNPSIAGLCQTPDNLDPTLRRVRGFTRAAGFSGFRVLNLYSLVSTDPAGLAAEDPDDLSFIREGYPLTILDTLDRLVCAWGANKWAPARARRMLPRMSGELLCLGVTKDGWPVHPLYQPSSAVLVPWKAP